MRYAALWDATRQTLEMAQKRCRAPSEQVALYLSALDYARIGRHLHEAGTSEYNPVDCRLRGQLPSPIVVTLTPGVTGYYR